MISNFNFYVYNIVSTTVHIVIFIFNDSNKYIIMYFSNLFGQNPYINTFNFF